MPASAPPANQTIAEVRGKLQKEIFDRKVMEEIPKVLKELRGKAEPQYFFKKAESAEDLYRDTARQAGVLGPEARPAPSGH